MKAKHKEQVYAEIWEHAGTNWASDRQIYEAALKQTNSPAIARELLERFRRLEPPRIEP